MKPPVYQSNNFAAAEAQQAEMNASRGRAAKAKGDKLEDKLKLAHQMYAARGWGVLSKLNPQVRGAPGQAGRQQLFYAGPGDCDFIGWVLCKGGARPIAFDAKSTRAASFSLPTIEKNAKAMKRQIDFLLSFGQHKGAAGFLLVIDTELQCGWRLRAEQMLKVKAGLSIPLRSKSRDGTITHHQEHFPFSTMEEMALMNAPLIDWHRHLIENLYPNAINPYADTAPTPDEPSLFAGATP